MGLVFAALLETTFGVEAFFATLAGNGGAIVGDRIFFTNLFLGVELFEFSTFGVSGCLEASFLADFGVLALVGEFFVGLILNFDPGGNSKRKDRSMIVKVSLCDILEVCFTAPLFKSVGFSWLKFVRKISPS